MHFSLVSWGWDRIGCIAAGDGEFGLPSMVCMLFISSRNTCQSSKNTIAVCLTDELSAFSRGEHANSQQTKTGFKKKKKKKNERKLRIQENLELISGRLLDEFFIVDFFS